VIAIPINLAFGITLHPLLLTHLGPNVRYYGSIRRALDTFLPATTESGGAVAIPATIGTSLEGRTGRLFRSRNPTSIL